MGSGGGSCLPVLDPVQNLRKDKQFLEISGKCPGNFRECSGKFPGNVLRNIREISGKFPKIDREISGKIPGEWPVIIVIFVMPSFGCKQTVIHDLRQSFLLGGQWVYKPRGRMTDLTAIKTRCLV